MASEAFEKWLNENPAGQWASEHAAEAWAESRRQAVEACAEEVEAAACPRQCSEDDAEDFPGAHQDELGIWHFPWCPKALAARLRRLA